MMDLAHSAQQHTPSPCPSPPLIAGSHIYTNSSNQHFSILLYLYFFLKEDIHLFVAHLRALLYTFYYHIITCSPSGENNLWSAMFTETHTCTRTRTHTHSPVEEDFLILSIMLTQELTLIDIPLDAHDEINVSGLY